VRSRAAELGYANEWLELGLLNEAFLAQQLARYDAGADTNTEHYRWAAFKLLLVRSEWSDSAIADYLKLARLDGDVSIATSAIIALIDHPSLSDEQLQQLDSTTAGSPAIEKRWRRARMLRELRLPIVEAEAFRRLCARRRCRGTADAAAASGPAGRHPGAAAAERSQSHHSQPGRPASSGRFATLSCPVVAPARACRASLALSFPARSSLLAAARAR
jgi:hypothetical protein